jgi:hypothetical protein
MAVNLDDIIVHHINGSTDRGGWEMRFTSLSDTDAVVRWENVTHWWQGAFGAPPGVLRVGFNGWVLPQRFEFDRAGSQADFIAQTSDGFLRRAWCQGIGFAEVLGARAHYHEFQTVGAAVANMDQWLTLGKIVTHLLGYYDNEGVPPATNPDWVAHTNMVFDPVHNPGGWITLDNVDVLNSAHIGYDAVRGLPGPYEVRETDNLWERLREIARNEFYQIYFDKTDTLWYQPHPMFTAPLPNPVMTFDASFAAAAPIVTLRDENEVRQVVLNAVDSQSNVIKPIVKFPAAPTVQYGNVRNISRIRCDERTQLVDWAERVYLFANRPYTVTWTAAGLVGLLFEINDRVQITYTGTAANGVHIDWTEEKFWISDIQVTPDERNSGLTTFILEAENT